MKLGIANFTPDESSKIYNTQSEVETNISNFENNSEDSIEFSNTNNKIQNLSISENDDDSRVSR